MRAGMLVTVGVLLAGVAFAKDKHMKGLYETPVAEGWKDLVYLPKDAMCTGDFEGTVDGCHPNDLGMMSMSEAFGKAVKEALHLK